MAFRVPYKSPFLQPRCNCFNVRFAIRFRLSGAGRPPYQNTPCHQNMCGLLDFALTLPLWPQSQPAQVEAKEEIAETAMPQARASAYLDMCGLLDSALTLPLATE